MSAIAKYIKPYGEKINGTLRPEHHFWLDLSDHDDHTEVALWISRVFTPQTYQYWPETVAGSTFSSATIQFHVILHQDRDAMLFKLRW
jgi:hypothetical protein